MKPESHANLLILSITATAITPVIWRATQIPAMAAALALNPLTWVLAGFLAGVVAEQIDVWRHEQ